MFAAHSMAKTLLRSLRACRCAARSAIVWVSLVSFVVVASGAPLPEAPQLGHIAGPYPCQGHRCGCRSAEDCWKGCCCSSQREKLAWAKRNGVTPPAFVAVAAAKETKSGGKSCCSAKAKSCCSVLTQTADSDDEFTWSLALQRAKCRGAATEWLSLGACMPLVMIEVAVALPEEACAALEDEWTLSPVYRPAAPPPRAA